MNSDVPFSERGKYWHDWKEWPDGKPSYTSPTGRPTPKWRGNSLTDIRHIQDRIADAHRGLRVLNELIHDQNKALVSEIETLLGIEDIALGHHECSESPTKLCIYHPSDIDLDACMFCEDPHDRQ